LARTATGFVKFKYLIRSTAKAEIDAFAQSLPAGSCVKVYGFAGFNAKQWAQDISDKRAHAVADYLKARGFQTVVITGLSKTEASKVLGSSLAHNRMVVLAS
jgi:outer membrane protein OmpA-like peptidoglycan-associated protein